ncbi:MAG TPA: hypothetical protein DCL61_17745 [Cyanobacteria bacterium UBA12227]|nr:hypothetical protein [Cyanobacteria bacterium UBA12227]HAX86625.1 hypothetical protein [Cyanobacteria bacterium UBA11370]HBY80032.1 hypothetical protein [Cyanobacteria bacterium UBA11148]
MKMLSPIQVYSLVFFCLLVLLMGGWFNRNQILAQFYFMHFQRSQTDEVKCQNLLQILRVSPEANLNSVIRQVYPEGQYDLKRSTILFDKYAVAELQESARSVALQKEWKGSMLQVRLFKKQSNGNFQIIYSCEKFMG